MQSRAVHQVTRLLYAYKQLNSVFFHAITFDAFPSSYYHGPHSHYPFRPTPRHQLLTAAHGHTPFVVFYASLFFSSGEPSPRNTGSDQHHPLQLYSGLKSSQFHPPGSPPRLSLSTVPTFFFHECHWPSINQPATLTSAW